MPQSFHDEPFVIDNAPLGIDVGEQHADSHLSHDGKDWLRRHTAVDTILVLRKKGNAVEPFETRKLDGEPLTIELSAFKEKPATKDASLELRWERDKDSEDQMQLVRFKTTNIKLETEATGSSRRLRQPTGSGLRILKIEGGGVGTIPFDGKNDAVFVVFYASKH